MGLFDSILGGNNAPATPATPAPTTTSAPESVIIPTETPTFIDHASVGTEASLFNGTNNDVVTHVTKAASPISPEVAIESTVFTPTPATNDILALSTGDIESVTHPQQEEASPVILNTTPDTSNDTITVVSSEDAPAPLVGTEAPVALFEVPSVEEEVAVAPEAMSSLFGGETSTTETSTTATSTTEVNESQAPISSLVNEVATEDETPTASFMDNLVSEEEIHPQEGLDSTAAFIGASLAQLTAMMEKVSAKKQQYLDEAAGYKKEKESFAQKEAEAHENASSMDGEIAHIKSMQRYFETQKEKQEKGSAIDESVNTALTGISVQENVKGTIEKKTVKHPPRAKAKA